MTAPAARLPAPWEGVTGTARSGWLLSLDDRAQAHRDALVGLARNLRRALLVGNPAPVVSQMWARLSQPRPGDLVAECSRAIYRGASDDDRWKGLGILLAHRSERDGDAWYIQYGNSPRDIARWENADFMTVPTDPGMFT